MDQRWRMTVEQGRRGDRLSEVWRVKKSGRREKREGKHRIEAAVESRQGRNRESARENEGEKSSLPSFLWHSPSLSFEPSPLSPLPSNHEPCSNLLLTFQPQNSSVSPSRLLPSSILSLSFLYFFLFFLHSLFLLSILILLQHSNPFSSFPPLFSVFISWYSLLLFTSLRLQRKPESECPFDGNQRENVNSIETRERERESECPFNRNQRVCQLLFSCWSSLSPWFKGKNMIKTLRGTHNEGNN